jgi:hypothetical protein
MHWDDTQIARIAAILGVAKLLKELLWTKTSRRIGASLLKKIISVPRGIRNSFKKTGNLLTHNLVGNLTFSGVLTTQYLPGGSAALQKKL